MNAKDKHRPDYPASPPKKAYKQELHELQVELVKLQKHIIARGDRILVLFEGCDSGGKDGTIKRIAQHLSPRETRVVAPWTVVRADDKKLARLSVIKDLLTHLDYQDKDHNLIRLNPPDVVFNYAETYLDNGMISP
jgi:polyphosphate kinase 2 (PPK2 family)